ncbi:hypothetical protein GCM10025865_05370 [Paraoerskovia sediminicola]|uniref:Uncharacterized protein n=1 Tax=Paraoerskovia sediminicola TaxID=1138587 RepID=A0ABM8FZP2_9CELL|nr:hypothetical protein GCM10025865_05370 [Paraoerskovia sediminicola]
MTAATLRTRSGRPRAPRPPGRPSASTASVQPAGSDGAREPGNNTLAGSGPYLPAQQNGPDPRSWVRAVPMS